MADHNRFGTLLDKLGVDLAEGGVPFLTALGIDGGGQVLVKFAKSVTGEMLEGSGQSVVLQSAHIGACITDNGVGVLAGSTDVDDGVEMVFENVDNGAEGPMISCSTRILCGDDAHLIGKLLVACLSGGTHRWEGGGSQYHLAGAVFHIGYDDSGKLPALVDLGGTGGGIFGGCGVDEYTRCVADSFAALPNVRADNCQQQLVNAHRIDLLAIFRVIFDTVLHKPLSFETPQRAVPLNTQKGCCNIKIHQ